MRGAVWSEEALVEIESEKDGATVQEEKVHDSNRLTDDDDIVLVGYCRRGGGKGTE